MAWELQILIKYQFFTSKKWVSLLSGDVSEKCKSIVTPFLDFVYDTFFLSVWLEYPPSLTLFRPPPFPWGSFLGIPLSLFRTSPFPLVCLASPFPLVYLGHFPLLGHPPSFNLFKASPFLEFPLVIIFPWVKLGNHPSFIFLGHLSHPGFCYSSN